MTLSARKNVRILTFGVTGSAAKVLRASGSNEKNVRRQEMKGWGSGFHRKILRALRLQPPLLSWDLVICIVRYISPLSVMLFFSLSLVILYPF